MFISSVSVRGFVDLPAWEATDLTRVVRLSGPSPRTTSLGDAIQLAFAALSPALLRDLLHRWDVVGPDEQAEILGERFPEEASWSDTEAARAVVDDGRHLKVGLALSLDPPLYGQLRQQAARDPRLVSALADDAHLHLEVGALFANTHDAVALAIHRVAVGSVELTTQDRERWGNRLLATLPRRFHRFVPERSCAPEALSALTSRDDLDAYQAWSRALAPDGPTLRAARGAGGRTIVLADERPLSRWGRRCQQEARLAAAIHLSGADILWAESEDPALAGAVDGDASPLEQVFSVGPSGDLAVEPLPEDVPSTTPLPTVLRPTSPT